MSQEEKDIKGQGFKCCVRVYGDWARSHQCYNNAKVEVEGKPYCGIHSPLTVATREEKAKRAATQQYKIDALCKINALKSLGYKIISPEGEEL